MTTRTRMINRRYRLERRIDLSQSTESWLGFDAVLHRAVAVTMPRAEMLRNGPFLVEFLQRSRIATALHHRGIVAAFDSGEDGDTPYLVTEYLGGESLSDIIRAESPFDADDVAILVDQLANALDYAHQRGFVHGQLTTDDVIVDGQGAAKLLGLGLPIGTSTASGELTVDRDIDALGAIAFEMLTGEEPNAVEPDSAGEAYMIDPDIPRNASDVVAIALGAGSIRFTSVSAFARSLSDWRAFDPGEYFIAPEPTLDWTSGEAPFSPFSNRASLFSEPDFLDLVAEPAPDTVPATSAPEHRNSYLLGAVLVLMVIAGVIVWHSSEPANGMATALPDQLDVLARLTGF